VSTALDRLQHGEPLEVREPQRRLDYVHVSDVASAFVDMTCSGESGCFSIGTGNPTTVRDLVETARSVLKLRTNPSIKNGDGNGPDVVARPERLLAMGWSPRVSLPDGLRDLAESIAGRT
jgi:GDP-L-fucose synthase